AGKSCSPGRTEKVPSSRHARMDGTHTGKFGAESVRAALRRVRGSAPNFVPRGKEFLSRACGQKWVPPGACRKSDTLKVPGRASVQDAGRGLLTFAGFIR